MNSETKNKDFLNVVSTRDELLSRLRHSMASGCCGGVVDTEFEYDMSDSIEDNTYLGATLASLKNKSPIGR